MNNQISSREMPKVDLHVQEVIRSAEFELLELIAAARGIDEAYRFDQADISWSGQYVRGFRAQRAVAGPVGSQYCPSQVWVSPSPAGRC